MDTQSSEIEKLATAIVDAQRVLVPARKDATNPFFHSKYADLPAVWEALAAFREAGIAITQSPMDSPDGYIILDTQLTHTSGQWMRSRLKMRVSKDDPQGAGSALTYARRYALGCMTGLVTEEDDDGNAASQSKPTPKTFEQKFPAQPPTQAKNVVPTPNVAQESASLAPGSGWIVPFGMNKGQRICDISDGDVDWLLQYYMAKMQDQPQSKFVSEWEQAIMEIRAEQLQRYPDQSQG